MSEDGPPPSDEERGLDAGELEGALGLWLRLAQQKDLREFTRRFEGAGVSQLHLAILLVVAANPGCRHPKCCRSVFSRCDPIVIASIIRYAVNTR